MILGGPDFGRTPKRALRREDERDRTVAHKDNDQVPPVVMPVEDTLDLHTFHPREVPDLLEDYFEACAEKGILQVRVIHGKGTGTLRRKVESCLKRIPRVAGHHPAPPEAGGWGATLVHLKRTVGKETGA